MNGGCLLSNEIVKYNNIMNEVSFRKFNPVEFDLFFSLCSKMKLKGSEPITLTFDEVKKLTNYSSRDKVRFIHDLENMYSKMLNLNFRYEDETEIVRFVLFPIYRINKEKNTVTIGVNQEFSYVLNEITTNFTRFELEGFTELRSGYAKTMFRLLKQYKSTGFYIVKIDEFRRILDIPESYRVTDIDKRVLQQIEKELSPLYTKFEIVKKKKKGRGRGGIVSHLEFNFMEKVPPEKQKVPLHNWLEQ